MNPEARHHEVFNRFECWKGNVHSGFRVNFLGVRTRKYMALLEKIDAHNAVDEEFVSTSLPDLDEEYFQWIDVLESVVLARDKFVMIELGAGYGRWLVNAAVALRQLNNMSVKLVGVEAEPTHFQWMKQHMRDNLIDERSVDLVEAAVDAEDGTARFLVGKPTRWYGQSLWPPETETIIPHRLKLAKSVLLRRVRNVKTVSLRTILQRLDVVDLVDLDVQGSEYRVLSSAMSELNDKVRRVHVGTHGSKIELAVRALFQRLGWRNVFDYPSGHLVPTTWGPIRFQDGIQTWVNDDKAAQFVGFQAVG